MLWLSQRPVATAPLGLLAWEPPYSVGAALEKAKRQNKMKPKNKKIRSIFHKHTLRVGIFSLAVMVASGPGNLSRTVALGKSHRW